MRDLINREDAIKWFEPYAGRGLKIPVETVIQNLKDIPSAEPQIFTWGKEVHEYCKRNCGESKARMRDGDRFIVCGQANDEVCISLRKCPLDKWIAGEGFHIFPMDEPQTDCAWKKGAE